MALVDLPCFGVVYLFGAEVVMTWPRIGAASGGNFFRVAIYAKARQVRGSRQVKKDWERKYDIIEAGLASGLRPRSRPPLP